MWNKQSKRLLIYLTCKILFVTGTKLRCPFCERTYGYETNLRAHIRQRHQGIRVSCPYCPRTFTRNNTVRRHVQREHRNLPGRIPTKFNPTRVMPDPIRSIAAAAASIVAHQEASRGSAQNDNNIRAVSPQPWIKKNNSSKGIFSSEFTVWLLLLLLLWYQKDTKLSSLILFFKPLFLQITHIVDHEFVQLGGQMAQPLIWF